MCSLFFNGTHLIIQARRAQLPSNASINFETNPTESLYKKQGEFGDGKNQWNPLVHIPNFLEIAPQN